MRVELHIESDCEEPYAELHIAKLSASLQMVIEILEKEGRESVLTAQAEGKIYVIDPERIEVIRTEGRELALYDRQKKRFLLSKPLYELTELLGNDFVRISKSAIINFRRIDHVEASFNGTMAVVMKNGVEEVITRSYRQQFKKRLGV